ncbi:hypothetical protein RI129_009271 [Pyrocoelia pectoralis]|uniref:EB domain-containing protein n=1 Tax=Pyrocoelia pectoralis TaxID=417401 RepID=A0AAN7VBB7_9COLE
MYVVHFSYITLLCLDNEFQFFFVLLSHNLLVTNCVGQFLECAKNEDCGVETATCQNNICECPTGSVFSTDVTKCLPVALEFGAECEDSQQCGWLLGDHHCVNGKCGCAKGSSYANGRCVKKNFVNRKCVKDQDCFNGYDLLAMVCKENKCVCNDEYYLRGNFDCRPFATAVGEYCSLDSDCRFENGLCRNSFCVDGSKSIEIRNLTLNVPDLYVADHVNRSDVLVIDPSCDKCEKIHNAMCHPVFKKCHCKRGYTYNAAKNKCVGDLGVDVGCSKDNPCEIPYSRCVGGKCYCRKTYFTLDGAASCQKPMTHDNLFCNTDERCYVLGPYSKCEEKENENENENKEKECKCSLFPKPNDAFVCESPEDCDSNSDCAAIEDSICVANTCQCLKGYRVEDQSCVPNLGSKCEADGGKCTIPNASCNAESLCTCDKKFVAKGDTVCLPLGQLDSECQIEKQCSTAIQDSQCVDSKCKCKEKFVPLNGTCIYQRKMGDGCSDIRQCHLFLGSNVVCRNGYCACPANMTMNARLTDCESSASPSVLTIPFFIAVLIISFLRVF